MYTRTKSSAEVLLAVGARRCDSLAEVARRSEVMVSIVGYPHDVRAIFEEQGIIAHAAPGSVVKDAYALDMDHCVASLQCSGTRR